MAGVKKYILCKKWESKEEGRLIETTLDAKDFKGVEAFLKALHKKQLVTDEEVDQVLDVYFA